MTPSALIRYFKDCYDADNRRGTVWNVFHRDVAHRIFLDGDEDLLTGDFPEISVDEEAGRAAMATAYLARKERELLYCSLLVVGSMATGDEGVRTLCAPLLMHPASLVEQNGHMFLRPEWEERRINYRLLNAMTDDEDAVERIADILRSRHITVGDMGELIGALQEIDPGIDCASLFFYPNLLSEQEVHALVAAAAGALAVVSAALVGLFKKSVDMRGVLDELATMAVDDSLSVPVRALLLGEGDIGAKRSYTEGAVPAVLSDAQRRVLRSASTRPLTLVIGPPGTGKSYTIAAIAVEHISRGESVLIASKMSHAVDVVGNKIERQLGVRGVVVRGGRHTYSWKLRNRLNEILNGIRNVDASAATAKAKRLGTEATRLRGAIAALERSIVKRFDIARRRGEILASNQRGLSARFLLWYIRWRVGRESTLGTMIAELERLLERNVAVAARLVESINRERMAHVLSRHRTQLRTLLNALRARSGVRQEELLGSIDFRVLLRALPVWLTNLSDVHRVLPLSGELFDLAIIDEATQCDIASCLPIFQRARRVVVVGDPHQLRHLSFLSKARQRALVEKHGIPPDLEALYSYRDKSVLDFVNDRIVDQAGVVFLNEHFRSVPSIIGFSNEIFYGGALHIMTEGPEEDATVGVNVDVCEGRQEASGENLAEIRAIIRQVARYVEESGTNTAPSIGILSPFRRQADHISRHLAKALTMDVFRRHEIMIGTAHTFQGEERDIMLISLAVDDRSHSARMRFIERADVFNVTVTRARRIQHIYSSLTRGHSAADDSLLGRYLRHVAAPAPTDKETRLGSGDDVASEVAGELVRCGMTVRSSYRVAGSIVDLLIERGGSFCGVDLIGFPGHPDEPLSLERYRMFHRAGLRIVPVSYAEWAFKREDVLAAIAALLGGA